MGYNSFEELAVWKRACRLAVVIYESLPNCARKFTLPNIGIYKNTKATELVIELKEISSMLQGLIKSLALKT
jgi:hypothetical protein